MIDINNESNLNVPNNQQQILNLEGGDPGAMTSTRMDIEHSNNDTAFDTVKTRLGRTTKRVRTDLSTSLEDCEWHNMLTYAESDFDFVTKINVKINEFVNNASKTICKQLAADIISQFDSLTKLTFRLINRGVAVQSYAKGALSERSKLDTRLDNLGKNNDTSYAGVMATKSNKIPLFSGKTEKIKIVTHFST